VRQTGRLETHARKEESRTGKACRACVDAPSEDRVMSVSGAWHDTYVYTYILHIHHRGEGGHAVCSGTYPILFKIRAEYLYNRAYDLGGSSA
jgi:hypothetical protein